MSPATCVYTCHNVPPLFPPPPLPVSPSTSSSAPHHHHALSLAAACVRDSVCVCAYTPPAATQPIHHHPPSPGPICALLPLKYSGPLAVHCNHLSLHGQALHSRARHGARHPRRRHAHHSVTQKCGRGVGAGNTHIISVFAGRFAIGSPAPPRFRSGRMSPTPTAGRMRQCWTATRLSQVPAPPRSPPAPAEAA